MRKLTLLCVTAALLPAAMAVAQQTAGVEAKRTPVAGAQPLPNQSDLKPDTSIRGPVLEFDWPALQIGAGTYEDGPSDGSRHAERHHMVHFDMADARAPEIG